MVKVAWKESRWGKKVQREKNARKVGKFNEPCSFEQQGNSRTGREEDYEGVNIIKNLKVMVLIRSNLIEENFSQNLKVEMRAKKVFLNGGVVHVVLSGFLCRNIIKDMFTNFVGG